MKDVKKEEDAINSALYKIAKAIREKGMDVKTRVYDISSGEITFSLSVKASDVTEKKLVQSHSHNLLTGKTIAFINDRHDEGLVTDELEEWELDLEDVIVVRTDGDIDAGLETLFETVENGDAVFVGTVADFITDGDVSTIIDVLDDLEERKVLLISHLELGCSYDELRTRVKTAKVLTDALDGSDLYKYR